MVDRSGRRGPTSPITQLLHTLGMTRDDLTRHSEQMRNFLTRESDKSGRAFNQKSDSHDSRSRGDLSRERSRTGSVSNASMLARSRSPSRTPVKAEPLDGALPTRPMDAMEMVMERKSRKEKKDRRGSNAHSRDSRRVQSSSTSLSQSSTTPQATPDTPHRYRHYRESVVNEATTSRLSLDVISDAYDALPRTPVKKSTAHPFKLPEQPRNIARTPSSGRHIYSRHLASSSRASTPASSPARVVNIVSSPGPMRAPEEEPEELPYVLPPGPYSTVKPDFSYAAMIGQAILSSPQHRLTLQDIYEWITTVYPHYRRDEQTWMNSVRHALSTMAVFRKVPRGRAEGKSLWAILDCDIPCFVNGGFKKALCADMSKGLSSNKGTRKRGSLDETLSKKTKRRKTSASKEAEPSQVTSGPLPPMMPAGVLPPFFPSFHPNPHHQPYYQAYAPQLPAEYIFPPLPPSSNYHQIVVNSVQTSTVPASRSDSVEPSEPSQTTSEDVDEDSQPTRGRDRSPKPLPSLSSIPSLTPNYSSSSSPPLSSENNALDRESSTLPEPFDLLDGEYAEDDADTELVTAVVDALAPSATLLALSRDKGKSVKTTKSHKQTGQSRRKNLADLPEPLSPTMGRMAGKQKAKDKSTDILSTPPRARERILAPPRTPPRPVTPPRARTSAGNLQLSPLRTPLSHKGLHMSPSPSLAHYKSNLDPPPTAVFHPSAPLLSMHLDDDMFPMDPELLRTPSRRRTSSGMPTDASPCAPVTPRRLFAGLPQPSPFRTPSRPIFDPHDPGALLDDELNRMSSQGFLQESPTGFLGKMGLLYESPNVPSPGRLERYWG